MDIPPERTIARPEPIFKWGVISALVIVSILTIAALGTAIAAREGKLAANSVGNKIIRNSDKFVFRGVTVEGNTTLGENAGDSLTINADVDSHIIPNEPEVYDLGSAAKPWKNIYADVIHGISVTAGVCSIIAGEGIIATPTIGDVNISVQNGQGICVSTSGVSADIDTDTLYFNGNKIGVSSSLADITLTGGSSWQGQKIGVSYGGTGLSIFTTGDILYASDSNTISKLPIGGSGYYLTSDGTSPAWVFNSPDGVSTITAGEAINITGSVTDPIIGLSISSSVGLSIVNGGLSVVLGTGLDFDASGGISVQLGSGLEFDGNLVKISSSADLFGVSTITNNDGGLVINPADGTSSTVDIGISIAPLRGLSITSDGVSVMLGTGLDFDASGGISVQLGSGLEFDGNLVKISDSADLIGVSTITNNDGGLVINPANGTSSTVDIGISIAPLRGLSITSDGVSVMLANGLLFDTSGGISVQLGGGLEFVGNGISLSAIDFPVDNILSGNGITVTPNSDVFTISAAAGNGIISTTAGISVKGGQGICVSPAGVSAYFEENKGLVFGSTGGLSVQLSNGLDFASEGISVQLGSGLQFNGIDIEVNTSDLPVNDVSQGDGITVTESSGNFTVSASAGVGIEVGSGISVAGGQGICVSTAGVSVYLTGNNGLHFVDNGLSVQLSNGLLFDTSGGISVHLGNNISFGTGGKLDVDAGVTKLIAGEGISLSPANGTDDVTVGVSQIIHMASSSGTPGTNSILLGGSNNSVSGNKSGIVGGSNNSVLGTGTEIGIVGGSNNSVSGSLAGIVGGEGNIISIDADDAGIVGGTNNTILGTGSGMVGGFNNIVSGTNSSIVGGTSNNISVINSVALGGEGLSTFTGTSYGGHLALVGKFNSNGVSEFASSSGGTSFRFVVGSGTASNQTNAFSVDNIGNLYFGTTTGASIHKRKADGTFTAINSDANVNKVTALNTGIKIGSDTGDATIGLSIAPLMGLSITSDGVSVMLGNGLDFDTSGGISVQLGNGLAFDSNSLILDPPHTRMFLSGPSVQRTFNVDDIISFNGTSGDTSPFTSGTSSFTPPITGFYNSSVHLFNGASSATSGSVVALQDANSNVLQRCKTFGLDDVSFSGIYELTTGTSYSLKVDSGAPLELMLGKGYSEWSVHYIAKS